MLSRILKQISFRTLNHTFSAFFSETKKNNNTVGVLARVMDKILVKKQLKFKFKIFHENYIARCIEINNNLWKMKNIRTKTQLEKEYQQKSKKLSIVQSLNV